jgi:hypothetical protein
MRVSSLSWLPATLEIAYLENSLHLRELGEWVLAREHFDNETAKTPNICLARVRGLLDNLGGHPEYRALQRRTMALGQGYAQQRISDEYSREVRLARTIFDLFRDAKIGKLDTAFVVDEDVRTLDVTVDDRLPMEVLQSAQDLSDPVNSE